MGQTVNAAFGPMAAPGAGNHTFIYSHPADGKPSRIGLIASNISAGTQTGKVTISYGNDATTALEIGRGVFTASQPSYALEAGIVIQPGQVILIHMYDITAGDTIRAYVEGH
jgi:hypothetical protein